MSDTYDLYCKFDLEMHKKTYINYLEVSVFPDGHIEYAIPSHQQHLENTAAALRNVSIQELREMCPEDMRFDYLQWLCDITGCAAVWDFAVRLPKDCSPELLDSLSALCREDLLHFSMNNIAAMRAQRALRDSLQRRSHT